MSDTRGYIPGQTGTLSDVIERGPELAPFMPAGPDGFKPPPDFGAMFSASRPRQLQAQPLYDDIKLRDGYAPIVDALGLSPSENPAHFNDADPNTLALTGALGQPSDLATAAGQGEALPFGSQRLATRQLQEQLIAQQIRARRASDKNFLSGVPDDVDGLHHYFEQAQAAKRAAGDAVLARGSTVGRITAGLAAGGVEGVLHNPWTLPSLLIGGGTASSLVQAAGRDALINGVLTAGQLPTQIHNMAENDEHLTFGEGVGQVVGGAVFGGIFGGVLHVAGERLPPALFAVMPDSVQTRWAARMRVGPGKDAPRLGDVLGDMDNRELAGFARTTIGERMTPDEKGAANALERSQEIGEASPFMPGPAGDAAHNASVADTLKSIIDGTPRQSPKADLLGGTAIGGTVAAPPLGRLDPSQVNVPSDIVDFFKAKGLDDARAYGVAAGIVAESGGDHLSVNRKSGAIGLGQWLGGRKAALIERYGPNPSRADQLEFLWGELNGGDPGGKSVLAARDAGQALDAYVRNFMRPAAGAETVGDLERGMAALGRKGEMPVAGGALGSDEDAIAALGREADQAEQDAIDGSARRDRGDEAGAAPALEAADYPILKRELFGSDRDWFDAQVAFYHSQGLVDNSPQEAAAAAPGRETGADGAGQPGGVEAAPGASSGPFGREMPEAAGDWQATLAALRAEKGGVVPGALDHPEIGPIDLPYGVAGRGKSDGYGLAKLEAHHPEVVADLPEIVRSMKVTSRTENRIQLEGPDHKGAVSLDYMGAPTDQWLLTAFAKDADHLPKKAPALPDDERGSTPLPPDDRRGGIGGRDGSPGRGAGGDIGASGPIDNAALNAFDAPGGDGARLQTGSLEHDARAAIAADPALAKRAYQIDDSGKPRTLAEILAAIDDDRKAAAALRACAGGNA